MPCSDILKWGIFDYSTTRSDEEFFHSIYKWFDYNTYQTEEETKNAAMNAGIRIPTEIGSIPLNFDGTYGRTRKKTYSQALKDELWEQQNYRRSFFQENITASSVIVSEWRACEQFNTEPLFGQALYNSNYIDDQAEELLIKVKLNYIDPEHPDEVYIDAQNIEAELDDGYQIIPFNRSRLTQKSWFPFTIRRNKQLRKTGGHIIVNTSHDSYRCAIELAPLPDKQTPSFAREYDDPNLKRIREGGEEMIIRNLKDKNLFVNVYAEFFANGLTWGSTDITATLDDEVRREKVHVPLNGPNKGVIHRWIHFGAIAWMPGIERKLKAKFENHGFDTNPAHQYIHTFCEY